MPRQADPDKMQPVMVRLPPALLSALDAERGRVGRSEFVRCIIEDRFGVEHAPTSKPKPRPANSTERRPFSIRSDADTIAAVDAAAAAEGVNRTEFVRRAVTARTLDRRDVTPIPKSKR